MKRIFKRFKYGLLAICLLCMFGIVLTVYYTASGRHIYNGFQIFEDLPSDTIQPYTLRSINFFDEYEPMSYRNVLQLEDLKIKEDRTTYTMKMTAPPTTIFTSDSLYKDVLTPIVYETDTVEYDVRIEFFMAVNSDRPELFRRINRYTLTQNDGMIYYNGGKLGIKDININYLDTNRRYVNGDAGRASVNKLSYDGAMKITVRKGVTLTFDLTNYSRNVDIIYK